MVSTCLLISLSTSPYSNSLVTVPSAPFTIGITITFMFLSFQFSSKDLVLISFSLSFNFSLWSVGTAKSAIWQVLLFCWLSLGLVVWPRLGELFVSQNHREVCAFHFLGKFSMTLVPFVRMVKFKLLSRFTVDHLPLPVSFIFFFR